MAKKITETGNTEILNIRGIATFPEIVDGKISVCIGLDDERIKKVIDKSLQVNEELEMTFNEVEFNEQTLNGVHAKSRFTVPVYDADGNIIEDETTEFPVFWGADIIARIALKEYTYKAKQGVTAYLLGVKVLEQGEKRGVKFEDFDEE